MDNFPPVQDKRMISRLSKTKPIQERSSSRMVNKMTKNAGDRGLISRNQTIELVELMMRIEDSSSKLGILKTLANTKHVDYLKLFISNNGLKILYRWMLECKETDFHFKIAILKALTVLPVSSETSLKTSKVWYLVEKWSNFSKKNGQDDILIVDIDKSDEKGDKGHRLSSKVIVSNRSSKEALDLTKTSELEKNCHQSKTSQTKNFNQNDNDSAKKIQSINLDSERNEKTKSQVQTNCYDQSGKISEDFVQSIIMQMAIILKKRKLQSEINPESPQSNNINCDKESLIGQPGIPSKSTNALSDCQKPSNSLRNKTVDSSSKSTNALSDCQKPSNSLRNKTVDSTSKSKDVVKNCADNKNSKPKNWTAADVSILAKKLFEQWKVLKEVFKIPKLAAKKPVEIEKNNKKTEVTGSSKAEKTSDSSKTSATKSPSKTTNNINKNIEVKRDNNRGNKETNQQKIVNKHQDVPRKSNTDFKKHRGGRRRVNRSNRSNRLQRFQKSYPTPDLRYQFGPQDYLGLCQPENFNYEYYPNNCYLNQLPWQRAPSDNYR